MAELKQRIKDEMKAALLSGDRFVGETLRNLSAAILDEEVRQNARDTGLTDEQITQVIIREIKRRADSARIYRENDRPELADPEEREIAVLQVYLPEPLSDEELRAIVRSTIAELGVADAHSMGQVIGAVKAKVGAKADGATIAQCVKQMLTK